MSLATEHRIDPDLRHCVDLCQACHAACTECAAHCLTMGGAHAEPGHIALLLDCADICRASADSVLRGSAHWNYVMGVCAFLCERCAIDCERLGGDTVMEDCARACRACHEHCLRLSKQRRQHDPVL